VRWFIQTCHHSGLECPSKAHVLRLGSQDGTIGRWHFGRWGLVGGLCVIGGVALKGIMGICSLPLFCFLATHCHRDVLPCSSNEAT
jgi:hypothetical protein